MANETKDTKIRELVRDIVSTLDCTQKNICSLIGVTETTLSTSMEKTFRDVADNKVGKRLLSLLYVVNTLKQDEILTAPLMLKILVTPAYEMEDGTYLDVASAIHAGEYHNELLVHIADAAIKKMRSRYEAEKRPARSSLYSKLTLEIGFQKARFSR